MFEQIVSCTSAVYYSYFASRIQRRTYQTGGYKLFSERIWSCSLFSKMSKYMCDQMMKWVQYNDKLPVTNMISCVLNALFALGTIVGNALVILAIVRTTALHKPSYVLLCTLAFSDFCVGLIVQPLFAAVRVAEMSNNSDVYCKLGMAYFSTCGVWLWLSCFTIVAVSVDRLLAVYLRMKYRLVVTVQRVLIAVAVMLLAAMLLAVAYVQLLPPHQRHHPTLSHLFSIVLLPNISDACQTGDTDSITQRPVNGGFRGRPLQAVAQHCTVCVHSFLAVLSALLMFLYYNNGYGTHCVHTRGIPCNRHNGAVKLPHEPDSLLLANS